MADFPDDASPSTTAPRHSSAPLPPFVAPRGGSSGARRMPQPAAPIHGGRGALARLYTPPAAPTVRRAADAMASTPVHDISRVEQPELEARADVDPSDARADVEQAAPETIEEPASESGVEASEYESSFVDQVANEVADDAVSDSAPYTPSDDAEPTDDDWFAAEAEESDAPPEPAHPTPAFNDLRGIERLASDGASDDFTSPYASYPGVSEESGSGDTRASHDDGAAAATPGEQGVQPMAPTEAQSHQLPARDTLSVVAEMLERTALRVRDGHLTLPSDLSTSSDAAALAAVLSALLRTPQS